MKTNSRFLFAASLVLAMALTFGCSDNKDESSTEQSYNYCITAGSCLTGPFTASTCTGQLSNSCPNGSSSSRGTLPSSSSLPQSGSSVVSSSSSLLSSSSVPPSSSSDTSSSSTVYSSEQSSSSIFKCDNFEYNPSTQYCSNGTLKNYGSVTYEGQTYKTVVIGTQTWMAENLNYNASGSICIDSCTTYGRLYNWATAMANSASSTKNPSGIRGVCPSGWHIPSNAEWNVLMKFVNPSCSDNSDCANAGTKLKTIEHNGTNDFGFSARLGGSGISPDYIIDPGYYGYWWSSSENSADNVYGRGVIYGNEDVFLINDNKYRNLFSVRCVQD